MVFTPEALRHLAAEVGASQLMMGTDYPYPWTKTAVDHILDTPGFSDADKRGDPRGNRRPLARHQVLGRTSTRPRLTRSATSRPG